MALIVFVFCISIFLQTISTQCINNAYNGIFGNGRALGIERAPIGNIYGTGRTLGIENAAIGNIYSPAASVLSPANGLTYETYGGGLTLASLAATNRGGVAVSSVSPIAPNGVRVQSENMLIEGPLAVNGKLPFLGTIAMDGALPAKGLGNVAYRCAGNFGMANENLQAPVAPIFNSLGPGNYGASVGSPVYYNAPITGRCGTIF